MERNFSIEQGIELRNGSAFVDVHNAYVLARVVAEPLQARVNCEFVRVYELPTGGGADYSRFVLAFSEVDIFEMANGILEAGDRGAVDEVGFKRPSDRDLDWLIPEGRQGPGDHLIIRMIGDGFLRISSRCASLELG